MNQDVDFLFKSISLDSIYYLLCTKPTWYPKKLCLSYSKSAYFAEVLQFSQFQIAKNHPKSYFFSYSYVPMQNYFEFYDIQEISSFLTHNVR